MKRIYLQQNIAAIIATLLVLPSLYFLSSALLYHGLGVYGPWSLIEPLFEQPGNKDLGLNINLLIVFGPFASLVIALFQVIKLELKRTEDSLRIIAFVTPKSFYWFIIAAALLCMGSMFIYFIGENCNCH